MIKLVEVYKQNLEPYRHNDITTAVRTLAINPKLITAVYSHDMTQEMEQGLFPKDFDRRHEFSRIVMNSNSAGGFSLIVAESLDRLLVTLAAYV